jgi:Ca-activated chloride channel family protein
MSPLGPPRSTKPSGVLRAPRPAPSPSTGPRPKSSRFSGGRVAILAGAAVVTLVVGMAYPALVRGPELVAATWRAPWWLVALLLVPLVLWRGTFGEDRRTPRVLLGTLGPLAKGPSGLRAWLRDLPGVVRAVALALLVAAMARPVSTLRPDTVDEEGIDAVLVLDLSGSMQAVMDNLPENLRALAPPRSQVLRPTRLDAAKAVIRDFIARRKTDRIGVVVFGKAAYVLSPPTLDYQLLDLLVSRMELKLIDDSATAIGDAVGVAVARLRRSTAKSKAVILLTDGDNNAGQIAPEYASRLAQSLGIKLFTIQIGSGETAEIQRGYDLFGQPRYVNVPFPVNPALLRQLAQETGGEMYIASDATALQASFHAVLDRLEKTRFAASQATFEDLYRFLLLPGVLLLALDALLRSVLLRRFP